MMYYVKLRLLYSAICLLQLSLLVSAQTKPEPTADNQDVIKFDTSLVQTDVMVFDKKGKFVDGLRPEQFVLKIDNKPREISFFERISSANSDYQTPGQDASTNRVNSSDRPAKLGPPSVTQGRAVIFFVDDLHLAPDSLVRTRKAILEFIDHGMGERDQVAITSTSGQIGFLQQFTPDKETLRSAVARLNYRANPKLDSDQPPMSEYLALKIREGDEQAIAYYVKEVQKQTCYRAGPAGVICPVSPQSAKVMVQQRAQEIVMQSAPATDDTLRLLEGLMRTAAQLPGRKLVFMISDGFYLNDRKTGSIDRIKKVTEAAGRAGVVIYTLDARGLVTEAMDVTNNRPADYEGLLSMASIGEISSSQDGLNALAGDTGGRAFRNTNAPMSEWVGKIIEETSNYYLLAWKPDNDEQKRGRFKHIEVGIVDRPDLKVRVRSAYFKSAALPLLTTKKKHSKNPAAAREDDLRLVIDAPVSQTQIPTEVDLHFTQMPGLGTRVTATISVDEKALTFELIDGRVAADVDLGGIFYDDKGKPIDSFVGRLRILQVGNESGSMGMHPEDATSSTDRATRAKRSVYRFSTLVPGGLYQVRVGVRDLKSSRIGSAMDWIRVPKI